MTPRIRASSIRNGVTALSALLGVLVVVFVEARAQAATSYTVGFGATVLINEFGLCKNVQNNDSSGLSLFVPTNSSEEWSGTYGFAIKTPAGVTLSACVAPNAPTIDDFSTYKSGTTYYKASTSVTIGGTCSSGNTVTIYGTGIATQTTVCQSSAYSFSVSTSADGSYQINAYQTYSGLDSSTTSVTWVRDNAVPAAVVVTTPESNPYSSGAGSWALLGTCEAGATVSYSGAATGSTTCTDSGTFSFTIADQSSNGAYTYTLIQTDKAGNASPSLDFQWQRDNTQPTTPTLTSPTTNPKYTKTSPLTIQVGCTGSNTVTMIGDASASGTCSSSSWSTSVSQSSDGTGTYYIYQTDANLVDSAQLKVTWVFDQTVPLDPTVTNPYTTPFSSSGSLRVSGTCEPGASVSISGATNDPVTCSSDGAYSFLVTKASDATYSLTLTQTDKAGNVSTPGKTISWTKDSSLPPTPTITSPSSSGSYSSNGDSIILAGTCQPGYTVRLSGGVSSSDITSPSGSLTQTCTSSSTFSFTVTKSTTNVNTSYSLQVDQSQNAINYGGSDAMVWYRNNIKPTTTLTPSGFVADGTNAAATSSVAFSASNKTASDGVVYDCKLDTAAYAACGASPYSIGNVSNGPHTLYVRATDKYGNVEASPPSISWSQSMYNSILLYYFDAPSPYANSGGGGISTLTPSPSPSPISTSSPVALAVPSPTPSPTPTANSIFIDNSTASKKQSLYGASDALHGNLTQTMTLEAFVNFASLSNNKPAPIAAKNSSSSVGWVWYVVNLGANTYIKLDLNLTTSATGAATTCKSSSVTFNTGTWYYIATTWNKGVCTFYVDGVAKGSSTLTAGKTIYSSTANVFVGQNGLTGSNLNLLDGYIDELRVSQKVRAIPSPKPTREFTAD